MGLYESKMGVGSPRVRGSWVYTPGPTPRASEEACAHEVLCAGLWGRGLPQPAGC